MSKLLTLMLLSLSYTAFAQTSDLPKNQTDTTVTKSSDSTEKAAAKNLPKADKAALKTIKLSPINDGPLNKDIMSPPPAAKVEAQNLPGVGAIPGDPIDLKNKVVKSGSERNEVSYISATTINRIATPFTNPKIVDDSDAEYKVEGGDVFVKPKSSKPISLFIRDDVSKQVISMTLVPKNLPMQTIIAELQTKPVAQAANDNSAVIPEEYLTKLTTINKLVAIDSVPPGFTKSDIDASIGKIGNVVVTPLNRYSGSTFDIYKYELKSGYTEIIELKEDAFFTNLNIRSISFYPKSTLNPGESTFMIVVSDKPRSELARSSK